MEKISFLIFCIVFGTQFVDAQNYTAKNFKLKSVTVPTVTTTYTARDSIVLTAGFEGDGTDGSITLAIDEELIFSMGSREYVIPDTIENRTINKEYDFGAIPGSFNVSSSGAAQYSIPIYTPPGVKGTTPALSVNYNSSTQEGLLGTAWTLSGTSTIHRMEKNYWEDSTVSGIDLETTDLFGLDGNRLILISGSHGQSGSIYTTKFESFKTIEAFGSAGNGPEYFKVTDNRGNIYEYGNTSDSKINLGTATTILGWKLNKITDPNGNYMTYGYDNSVSGQAYLTSIKYSGNTNASLDPYNEIKILYQIRSDDKIKYLKGEQIDDKYLVRKIQVESFENQLREYQFNYSLIEGKTFLSEVIEKNANGEQFNSTIIGWNDFADTIKVDSGSDFLYTDNIRFGDFNMDGYDDYFAIDKESGQFTARLFLNNGSGGFTSSHISRLFNDKKYVDHFVGDFNADGRSDAVIVVIDTCVWEDLEARDPLYLFKKEAYYKYYFVEYAGTSLSIMDIIGNPRKCSGRFNLSVPWTYTKGGVSRFHVGDFNGDSFSDFLVGGDDGLIMYGNEEGEDFTYFKVDIPFGLQQNFVADFNGDARIEYATFESDSIFTVYEINDSTSSLEFRVYINANPDQLNIADFNADGIADLYYLIDNDGWYIQFGNGINLEDPIFKSSANLPDVVFFNKIIDFNADGKDDFIYFIHCTGYPCIVPEEDGWYIMFNESMGDGTFFTKSTAQKNLDFDFDNSFYADINGDGCLDLITPDEDSYFMYNPDDQHNLVRFIENGTGARTTINYSTLLDIKDTKYFQDGNYSFPLISITEPLTVVDSYNISSSLHDSALISKSSYKYTDAVIHKQMPGFMGFKNIEIKTDSVHSLKTFNSFSAPEYYAFQDSLQSFFNENLVSSFRNQKKYCSNEHTGGISYLLYPGQHTSIDYLNGNVTEKEITIDTITGNLTSSRTTYHDGSYNETLYYDYLKSGSNFPQRIIKRQKHKDDTNEFSVETRIKYDTTTYQIENLTENYGKSNELSIEFKSYNHFGVPTRKEVTPKDLSTEVITTGYDHTGRFLMTKENALGEVSYCYDTIRAYLTMESDLYDNQVLYCYDNWGVKKQTISPTGLKKTFAIDWSSSSDPSSTLYTVLVTDSLSTYSKQFVDFKGRVTKTEKEGFEGNIYFSETTFNEFNQADSSSNLYVSSGSPLWNTFSYRTSDGRIGSESLIGGAGVSYTYNSNQLVKTINSRGFTTNFDAMGNVISVEDPIGLELDYSYYSNGGYKTINGNGGTISYYYNDAGLDTTSVDPAHGTANTSYNSLGQPTWVKDGKGNEFDITYDTLNRVIRTENSNNAGEYYTVSYVTSGNGKGQILQKSYTNGNLLTTLNYTYDEMGRLRTENKTIGSKSYTQAYRYDEFGRLDSITTSEGHQFDYRYDDRSYLTEIYFDEELVWELTDLDLTAHSVNYGKTITVTSSFNSYGQLTSIEAGDLFDMSFSFNTATGNLTSRSQDIYDLGGSYQGTLTENFTYDSLDRLLDVHGPNDTLSVSYNNFKEERIGSKSDAGEVYNYSQNNAFQLESIDTVTNTLLSRPDQRISYTSFNKVDSISEGEFLITFDYGPNQERVRMKVSRNDTLQYSRYYFGGYELTEFPGSQYQKDTWFTAEGGIYGFHREKNTTDSIYYVIKDHLGSIMAVAGEDGGAREFLSYDAWGRRRKASDWTYDTTCTVNYTSRGFTGHEHIDETWLINMNGRVYDPLVGLFISPDPVIQEPLNPLNYNRYSYVLNNPLKYTDPSGYRLFQYFSQSQRDEMRSQWFENWSKSGGGGGGSINYPKLGTLECTSLLQYDYQLALEYQRLSGDSYMLQSVVRNMYNLKYSQTSLALHGRSILDNFTVTSQTRTGYVKTGEYMTWSEWTSNKGRVKMSKVELLDEITYTYFDVVYLHGFNQTAANRGVSGDNIFVKTYLHFQFGGRDPLTIDASTLDFGNISRGDLKDKGNGRYGLNLYDKNPTSQAAIALGKITLIDQGNNSYSIVPDYYDFNIERQNGFSQRNIATFGAGILHYGVNPIIPSYPIVPIIFGGPYWIHFQGNVHIKP